MSLTLLGRIQAPPSLAPEYELSSMVYAGSKIVTGTLPSVDGNGLLLQGSGAALTEIGRTPRASTTPPAGEILKLRSCVNAFETTRQKSKLGGLLGSKKWLAVKMISNEHDNRA